MWYNKRFINSQTELHHFHIIRIALEFTKQPKHLIATIILVFSKKTINSVTFCFFAFCILIHSAYAETLTTMFVCSLRCTYKERCQGVFVCCQLIYKERCQFCFICCQLFGQRMKQCRLHVCIQYSIGGSLHHTKMYQN